MRTNIHAKRTRFGLVILAVGAALASAVSIAYWATPSAGPLGPDREWDLRDAVAERREPSVASEEASADAMRPVMEVRPMVESDGAEPEVRSESVAARRSGAASIELAESPDPASASLAMRDFR